MDQLNFKAIPSELLRIIQRYLSKQGYRNLLNTSKAIFQHSKFETVYYNIKIPKIEDSRRIVDYLSILCHSVKDKNLQISIKITRTTEEILQQCVSLISGVHHLSFQDINSLWEKGSTRGLFCHIYHLKLQGINFIDRLSGLSDIKILEVRDCRSLITIDFIPGLKRLILHSLNGLSDISQYGNIPELKITVCPQLSLQGIGNHDKLSIIGSRNFISYDIARFQNVKSLHLQTAYHPTLSTFPFFTNLIFLEYHGCNDLFDCIYFPNLRFLRLISANFTSEVTFPSKIETAEFYQCSFDDLSKLRNVRELNFSNCQGRGFHNVNSLLNVYKLVFDGVNELEDVSSLGEAYNLSLVSCKRVKDISKLGRVHRLRVEECGLTSLQGLGQRNSEIVLSCLPSYIDLSPLKSTYKVILKSVDSLVDGRELANVQHLTICNCKNFEDTSALSKVRSLCLVKCSKIKRLVDLENVSRIHLEICHELEDIDCLGLQQSLIILECTKLNHLMETDVTNKYKNLFNGISLVKINADEFSWFESASYAS